MTNPMSAASAAAAGNPQDSSNWRLWFEFAASATAWLSLGCLDMVIAWRACVHQEQFGGPSAHPVARILYFAAVDRFLRPRVTGRRHVLPQLAEAVAEQAELLRAEGRERKEFMSLCGLFISVTLGIGFFWMCLPLFMLQMCARTR